MENLEFVRIDDRLIHGQVVAAWLHAYGKVSHILIIDDKVSTDQFMQNMFKALVPSHISIEVKNVDDAQVFLKEGIPDPTMIIVKDPATLKRVIDGGVDIPKINIGGMGMTAGRKKLFQNVSASQQEREIFAEWINAGIVVEIQIIPAAKTINVASILK